MKEVLDEIAEIIGKYETGEWQSVDNLRVLLRRLSSCHYRLTKYNIEFAQDHNKAIYQFDGSDAGGQRYAELTVPQLRITRKILTSVSKVIDSIRSEISIIKQEG